MLYQENTKKVRKFGLKFPKDRNNLPTFGAVQDMSSVITDFVNLNKPSCVTTLITAAKETKINPTVN